MLTLTLHILSLNTQACSTAMLASQAKKKKKTGLMFALSVLLIFLFLSEGMPPKQDVPNVQANGIPLVSYN